MKSGYFSPQQPSEKAFQLIKPELEDAPLEGRLYRYQTPCLFNLAGLSNQRRLILASSMGGIRKNGFLYHCKKTETAQTAQKSSPCHYGATGC